MWKRLFYVMSGAMIVIGMIVYSNVRYEVFRAGNSKGIVVLDVGHGGWDPGKVSDDGTKEKDINLQIAKYLKDYLIAQDYTVYLDRETDCGLSDSDASRKKASDMRNRIGFFNKKKADFVISIHQNSFSDSSSHGAQVFYYQGSRLGQRMAEQIQESLRELDETNHREMKANSDYYILKKSQVPTVIVECGFLSNPEELANLKDEEYQKQLAYAICMGFCKFDQ